MDKEETRVCTSSKQGRVGAMSVNCKLKRKDVCTRKYYHDALTGSYEQRSAHSAKQRRVDTVLVYLQIKERRWVHKEILSLMYSPSVMDKGEKRVRAQCKVERRVDAVLVNLQMKEKRCAQKEILSWCTHPLWWTKEKRVCARCKAEQNWWDCYHFNNV